VHHKSSLAQEGPSLGYEIGEGAAIQWTGRSEVTAKGLLRPPDTDEVRTALVEAEEFLREILRDGPQAVVGIRKAAKAAGVTEPTLRRAKFTANVRARRIPQIGGKPGAGGWEWYLADNSVARSSLRAPKDHLEQSGQPIDREEFQGTVQDDQVIPLNDQGQLIDFTRVRGKIQDDHPHTQAPSDPPSDDDDSELF
jgi:hypothetical protein